MSVKQMLIVAVLWALLVYMTACTPVYVPQKVMVSVPVYCHPAQVPPFINYISPVIPTTNAEMRELTAEIKVTLKEAVAQNKELREVIRGCERPK